MNNILKEKPSEDIIHRLGYCASFVQDQDVKEKKILDIGCGFGWFEINAVKRGVKEIVGVEASEADLQTARKSIKQNNVHFQVADAIDLPFENESFDTVVSWDVIEHIPRENESRMFSEARRVLKKDGVFYLSTPYKHIVSVIFDPGWWLIKHRHYNCKDLVFHAEKNNFKLDGFSTKGCWWEVFGIWDFYISKWIFRRKIFFQKFLNRKINREFENEKGFVNLFVRFIAI